MCPLQSRQSIKIKASHLSDRQMLLPVTGNRGMEMSMPSGKILAVVIGVALSLGTVHAADKPNVVFILADDLGFGDLSHAGGRAATPHCDRLAREGMRFTAAQPTSTVIPPPR